MSASHFQQKTKASKVEALAPIVVGLSALLVYALTISRDVGLGDSAELSLQAWKLGVTHPPGYPVHTLLGKLFTLVFTEPAMATNVLSAVSAALAAGLLTRIALRLSVSVPAAVIAGILFAVLPTVWDHAIITEVYTLNTCILAWALLLAINYSLSFQCEPRAQHSPDTSGARADSDPATPQRTTNGAKATEPQPKASRTVLVLAVVLAISLGSSMANALVLPGFALLVISHSRRCPQEYWLAAGLFVIVGLGVVSWSLLRSAVAPPMGTAVVPDSWASLTQFLTGSQYASSSLPSPAFVLHRILEHATAWANAFLWIGIPFAAAGLCGLWRRERKLCLALLIMFIANFGYFTVYPWVDYQSMVMTSYFLFCIWFALGVDQLALRLASTTGTALAVMVPAAIASLLVVAGLREHWIERSAQPAAIFARASLERFPPDALVIANWSIFTTLCYYQQIHDLRPDVKLVERSNLVRHYPWGVVQDWQRLAQEASHHRPVLIDALDMMSGQATESKLRKTSAIDSAWFRLLPSPERNPMDGRERD